MDSIISARRRGFTLIELLVVIAIIAVLIGTVAAGGTYRLREAARRASMQEQPQAVGPRTAQLRRRAPCLPAGQLGYPFVWSPQSQLLPFVEQANLQNLLNFDVPPLLAFAGSYDIIEVTKNDTAAKIRLPLMLCPSDEDAVPNAVYGGISYPACAGSGNVFDADAANDGFHQNCRRSDLCEVEGRVRTHHRRHVEHRCLQRTIARRWNRPGPDERRLPQARDRATDGVANNFSGVCTRIGTKVVGARGAKWVNGHYADSLYNHFLRPNAADPDCHNGFHNFAITNARSNHTGGVNVALCDGSVRFVSENVDLFLCGCCRLRRRESRC